jgi:NADH-quinone oxidoreductase subunit M
VLALWYSVLLFSLMPLLYVCFDENYAGFQFLYSIELRFYFVLSLIFGIDGISLWLIILTYFLIPICILVSWEAITYRLREFYVLLFVVALFLLGAFSVLDLFLFYVMFESILVPMFLIIRNLG